MPNSTPKTQEELNKDSDPSQYEMPLTNEELTDHGDDGEDDQEDFYNA